MSENKLLGSIEDNTTWQEGKAVGISPAQRAEASAAPGSNLQLVPEPQETEYTKRLKDGFGFFGLTAFLFACFYAFCMFRNPSGITYPFFVAGGLWFFGSAFQKLGISWKKGSVFYMAGIMLLAISTFCTDDNRIIWMNKAGIFLLLICLLLNQLYDTSRWRFGKYVGSIFGVVFGLLGEMGRPFEDAFSYRKKHGKSTGVKIFYMVAGIGIAVPIFFVVFLLLFSADAVFRELFKKLFFAKLDVTGFLQFCLMIAVMFLAVYCLLCFLCKKRISETVKDHHTGEPVLAITVTGILTALYLVFSVIQIVYLFLGQMQLPDGYTYAEYAREGFFQLLAVSVLNLVIVLVCMEYFRESRVLKAVLTVMSLCTFIMILSSGWRMIIYIRYYYLTFLRIFVLWSLVVLFLLFLGVAAGIFRKSFPLFRYSCVVVTCCYLVFSFGHPDYWAAKVNVAMSGMEAGESDSFFLGESYRDYDFLSGLSADAAPVLLPHLAAQTARENLKNAEAPEDPAWQGARYLAKMEEKRSQISLRRFNLSRFIAAQNLKKYSKYFER